MKKIICKTIKQKNEQLNEISNEINLLKTMDHPNIVKIFEVYDTIDGFYLITEYCSGGELFDKIIKVKFFEEPEAAFIMYQLLSAVFYCHNINIIHRDLKPENILISREEDKKFIGIKVIDFGTAKIFSKNSKENKVIGSAYYIAPEVLQGKYNEKCDIWSCGVIMYILLSGKPPFNGSDEEIYDKIQLGKFDIKSDNWMFVSQDAKDLIIQMLELNTEKRISAENALSHIWFKKLKIKDKITSIGNDKLKKSIQNIRQFKTENKLQQAALAFLVHNSLHLPEVDDLIRIFKSIDTNNDGKINKEELGCALSKIYSIPKPYEEVDEIFKNVDNDYNGYIEYEEYIRATIDKKTLLTDEILRFAFDFFDKDKGGTISSEEIVYVLFDGIDKETALKLSNELIDKIDLDDNKEINFDEFKLMMERLLR